MDQHIFQAIVEKIPEGIFIINKEGTIIYSNDAQYQFLGYQKDELQEENILKLIHETEKGQFLKLLELPLSTINKQNEIRLLNHKGKWRWALFTITPLNDSQFLITVKNIHTQKVQENKLYKLAFHDNLTGIANRSLFRDRLKLAVAYAKRNEKKVAIVAIDLDMINSGNELTFEEENEILKESGKRIVDCLRDTDTVSRHGSDEYMVILQDIANEDDAVLVAKKISSVLKEVIEYEGKKVTLNPYVGFSIYPTDASEPEQLIIYSDIALNEAQKQNKRIVRISKKNIEDSTHTPVEELKEFANNFK